MNMKKTLHKFQTGSRSNNGIARWQPEEHEPLRDATSQSTGAQAFILGTTVDRSWLGLKSAAG